MPFKPFENQNCSIARASEILSERWTMLIMREILLGRRRFSELKRNTGAASNILSDRLNTLVDHGLLVRVDRQEIDGSPIEQYKPTRKGVDVQPIILAMLAWGDKYESPDGAPKEIVHDACGHTTHPVMACSHCGDRIMPDEVSVRPGPGANERQIREYERTQRAA